MERHPHARFQIQSHFGSPNLSFSFQAVSYDCCTYARTPRDSWGRGGGVAGGSPRLQWKHVLESSRSTTLESVDVEASAVGAGLCSYRQPPPLLPRAAICFIFFPCVFSRSRYPRPKSPRAPSAGRQNGTVESPRHWDTLTDKGRAELPLRAHTGRVLLTPRCVRRGHFEDKIRSTTYLKESERERSGFGSALNVFFWGGPVLAHLRRLADCFERGNRGSTRYFFDPYSLYIGFFLSLYLPLCSVLIFFARFSGAVGDFTARPTFGTIYGATPSRVERGLYANEARGVPYSGLFLSVSIFVYFFVSGFLASSSKRVWSYNVPL